MGTSQVNELTIETDRPRPRSVENRSREPEEAEKDVLNHNIGSFIGAQEAPGISKGSLRNLEEK